VCGAAAEIALDQDRTIAAVSVALFGVSDRAVLVCECEGDLVGSDGADVDIEAAALSAARAAHGRDDINGSAEYRRHLAGVVTRRALVRAVERANERMVT
jgi:carbon-monoxide dehydrogenase medium subunit